MAGDWIKMRADLFEHPKVFKLAESLGVDEFTVVGMLFCFWSWADKHSVDGRVDAASSRLVDKCAHRTGFADALVSVGWLEIDADGITIPRFNEHNGDSAKERTLKNQRQARWRAGKKDATVDASTSTRASTEASTREEKRRSNTPLPPKGDVSPAFESFWAAWPQHHRKAAKAQCQAKWQAKGCEAIASQIVNAVNAAKRSPEWLKSNGEFIPAPLVWLNQARWEAQEGPGAGPALDFMGAA